MPAAENNKRETREEMKKLRTLLPVFLSAFVALIAANAGYAFAASTPPAEDGS